MKLHNSRTSLSSRLLLLIVTVLAGSTPHLFSQSNEAILNSLLGRADSLLAIQKLKQAEVLYKQALVFDSRSTAAFKGLGKIAFAKEKWRDVHEWFNKASGSSPDDTEVQQYLTVRSEVWQMTTLGDSLRRKDELRQAEKSYDKALDLHDKYVPALMGRAKIAYAKRDWKKFNKWIRKVLEVDPGDPEALELLQNNPQLRELLTEGRRLSDAGDYKAAEKAYKKVLKIDKNSIASLRWFGRRSFAEEDWGEVKDWFKKLLKVLPGDLESKYYLGIAYRETGKSKGNIIKALQFGTSRKYLDEVISADSSFRDVLYQRGQLERFKKNWLKAVQWGHRQIALKPDHVEANVGLLRFYRIFVEHRGDSEVANWLRSADGDWPPFIWGDYRRRKEDFTQAESVLKGLVERDLTFGHIPVYLSLVRLYIEIGNPELASEYFNKALNSLDTSLDAAFLFEESKYIFRPAELEAFSALKTPESQKAFFEKFWALRNPTPASEANARAMAHFKRMSFAERHYRYDGVRTWANNPDKTGTLRFPKTYYLNEEFNDKGLIYLRHGPPDDRVSTVGGSGTSVGALVSASQSNESWYYFRRDDREKMIFHFLIDASAFGNNWRLVPYYKDIALLEDRVSWDPTMARLLLASTQVEFNTIQNQVADKSQYQVMQAMSRDFHNWDRDLQELSQPYFVSYFRGQGGRTKMEIYVGTYVDQLLATGDDNLKAGTFEHGAAILDDDWNTIERTAENVELGSLSSANVLHNLLVRRYDFELSPRSYNVSIHSRLAKPPKIGLSNFEGEVPGFRPGGLGLSDFVLAYEIREADNQSPFRKGSVTVIPNPSKLFDLTAPVSLYFEVYNLTKNSEGETAYELQHTMTRTEKQRGRIKKALGVGDDAKKSISLNESKTGFDESSIEYTSFDVSNLEAGKYQLSVTVTDLNSGKSVQKSISLALNVTESK